MTIQSPAMKRLGMEVWQEGMYWYEPGEKCVTP